MIFFFIFSFTGPLRLQQRALGSGLVKFVFCFFKPFFEKLHLIFCVVQVIAFSFQAGALYSNLVGVLYALLLKLVELQRQLILAFQLPAQVYQLFKSSVDFLLFCQNRFIRLIFILAFCKLGRGLGLLPAGFFQLSG